MRTETRYYHTLEDGREVELPFDPEGADITEVRRGNEILLGCLVQDSDAGDPLEEFDEGALMQFDYHQMHDGPRPEVEEFQEVIRENRGRVFYVARTGYGYGVSHLALVKNAEDIEEAGGYYIAPADLKRGKQARNYAEGALKEYSAWCEGDVWGVCVWHYDAKTLELLDRDECWGYYGNKYAGQELESLLKEG